MTTSQPKKATLIDQIQNLGRKPKNQRRNQNLDINTKIQEQEKYLPMSVKAYIKRMASTWYTKARPQNIKAEKLNWENHSELLMGQRNFLFM